MPQSQAVEVLLRPAVELYTVAVCAARRVSVPGGPVVARAESAGPGQRARFHLRRAALSRRLGHPALPAQHPAPAALRDDQPRRAGQPAAAVRRPGLPLGPASHAPTDADVSVGVPSLRGADGNLSDGTAHGRAPGVRAVPVVQDGEGPGLGQPAEPGAAAAAGGRPAAAARHRAARGRRHPVVGRARRPQRC